MKFERNFLIIEIFTLLDNTDDSPLHPLMADPGFLRQGRRLHKVGAPTYNLLNFYRKLYANEKNWAERDGYEFFSVIKFTFLKLTTTDFRIIVLVHSEYYIQCQGCPVVGLLRPDWGHKTYVCNKIKFESDNFQMLG